MERNWQRTQSRMAEGARDNALPLALVGLGLGWLAFSGMRSRGHGESHGSSYQGAREGLGYGHAEDYDTPRYGAATPGYAGYGASSEYGGGYPATSRYGAAESYDAMATGGQQSISERGPATTRDWRGRASEMGDRMSHRAQDMGHRAQAWAQDTRLRMSEYGRSARVQAGDVADRSLHTMKEHPLMLGSMALLVGAAIGAALPRSRREDEWVGHERDEMLRRAQETGGDYLDRARRVAERTAQAARESGEQAYERVKHSAKDAAGEAYEHVRDTARDEAERQHLPGTEGYRH